MSVQWWFGHIIDVIKLLLLYYKWFCMKLDIKKWGCSMLVYCSIVVYQGKFTTIAPFWILSLEDFPGLSYLLWPLGYCLGFSYLLWTNWILSRDSSLFHPKWGGSCETKKKNEDVQWHRLENLFLQSGTSAPFQQEWWNNNGGSGIR